MEIKLFTELIDALGKVATGIKAIVNLPKAERDKYRQVMDDTYRLIDTTLNMVIIRLGDVLLIEHDSDFMDEVKKLDNYDAWIQAEREFRLCKSLREAVRETETLSNKLTGSISTNDWEALIEQMNSILSTEGELAFFIGQRFQLLAEAARKAPPDTVKEKVTAFREALIKERQELIRQEIELYAMV